MMVQLSVYLMSLLYIAAGCYHFIKPKMYSKIVPPQLPSPIMLVYISGAAEIILGLLLIPIATRSIAAWGIIVLLIAVFPANVQMMMIYKKKQHPRYWLTVLRLPIQLLLIWWAWLFT